jgi:hypothetical protein
MPELCRFYGIVIRMFINDHPPAHFHAEDQGQMVKITQLHVLEKYCLLMVFDDGVEKIIGFPPFIDEGPLTKPLSDPIFFRQVKIYDNGRGIYWPNNYDVCPDNLRYHIKSVETHVYNSSQKTLQIA